MANSCFVCGSGKDVEDTGGLKLCQRCGDEESEFMENQFDRVHLLNVEVEAIRK